MRVAYIVAAPVWKASYRLTLPADPAAPKAALQGWATVENLSGQDWKDVELHAGLGPAGRVPPGAVRRLLRHAAGSAGRGGGRLNPNVDRGGVAVAASAADRASAAPAAPRRPAPDAACRTARGRRPPPCRRLATPSRSRRPMRRRRSSFKFPQPGHGRQRPHALDPGDRSSDSVAAAGAIPIRHQRAQPDGSGADHQ